MVRRTRSSNSHKDVKRELTENHGAKDSPKSRAMKSDDGNKYRRERAKA
jgi:hypothetical protein